MNLAAFRASAAILALLAVGCDGGSAGGGGSGGGAGAPTGLQAVPASGAVNLTWTADASATSYKVYYATNPSVSTASSMVTASGTSANVPGLVDAVPYYFAVSAVRATGESPLSGLACAVPTSATTAGLTYRDGLCGFTLDGSVWWTPGLQSLKVSGGAAELSAAMDRMEPFAANGAQYSTGMNVATPGSRVTTLRGTVLMTGGSVRVGAAVQNRASLRFFYSPPANRLLFPAANQDLLMFEVGLIDLGTGLKAFRQVTHCDDASCATHDDTGISFSDPATWAAGPSGAPFKVADAAFDTAYTVEVRLAETEGTRGVFHWTVSGGAFGGGVSGTADPAVWLAATPSWSGLALSGTGFAGATMAVRSSDRSLAGGGSARVVARFDDVWVGINDGAAAAWDDFSGAGGNSGPTEFAIGKWVTAGSRSIALPNGALVMSQQLTSTGTAGGYSQALQLRNPGAANTIQADLRMASASASTSAYANGALRGRFYNSGGAGAGPGSAVGDVGANLTLISVANLVSYSVYRCTTANCSGTVDSVASGTLPGTVGSSVHTLLLKWDPAAQRFTFGADGSTVVVDPTGIAPYVGAANTPSREVQTIAGVPATAGAAASLELRVNNLFTAP